MLQQPRMAHVEAALLLLVMLQRTVLVRKLTARNVHLPLIGRAGTMTGLTAMLSRRGPLPASARCSGIR